MDLGQRPCVSLHALGQHKSIRKPVTKLRSLKKRSMIVRFVTTMTRECSSQMDSHRQTVHLIVALSAYLLNNHNGVRLSINGLSLMEVQIVKTRALSPRIQYFTFYHSSIKIEISFTLENVSSNKTV